MILKIESNIVIFVNDMSFTVRNLEEKDYEALSEWWLFWWKTPVHRKMLPDDISNGIMVEYNNEPVFSGFLYNTSSSYLFWMEFIVSSPRFKDKELRNQGLDYTIKVLIELAKRAGAKTIFSSIQHKGLINKCVDNGFVETDKFMTNLIYRVK